VGFSEPPDLDHVGRTLRGMLIRLLPAVLAAVGLGLGAHALSSHAAAGVPLLPDLDQETPASLVVTATGPRRKPTYVLGFRSAVRNIGEGPLIIFGHRHDRGIDTMVADQGIIRRGGPQEVVRGVGRLRYVISPDHRHWHLLGFDRYELRTPGGTAVRVRDRKTGFCLGDRYAVTDRAVPARAGRALHVALRARRARAARDHRRHLGRLRRRLLRQPRRPVPAAHRPSRWALRARAPGQCGPAPA
jgi:hypothetical protein